jgi:DNA invertase Pin-like site-specific DNA recombinase
MAIQAAIYCRSSKDRAEVGLAAQRAELKAYAKAGGFAIVEEFADMEICGSRDEESRPGLRKMLATLADPAR